MDQNKFSKLSNELKKNLKAVKELNNKTPQKPDNSVTSTSTEKVNKQTTLVYAKE